MRSPLAEARNDNASPRNGELIAGRYRVEGVIGSGGMGRVVAARDESGRAVAIKLLLSPPSERVWVERFFREARAVSRINSAHVVKVLAVSSPNEATPFIVMERLRGRDFGKRLRAEGPLTLRDVADCVLQACDALANSHHAGIVHRDVKPSNLFDHVHTDGQHIIKVLDFGISKARGHEEFEHTLTTSRDGMLGSPPYMSPEHIRDARSVDHRTDIWSLGVVAYQLLAGRLPFDGQSVGEVFCSVLERRFAPLGSVRPDVPAEVEAIIGRCVSRDPADRYQSAADLARAFAPYASPAIARLVDRMPTSIPPAPSSGPSVVSRAASPVGGVRVDGEVHTLTLPPTGVSGIDDPHLAGQGTASTLVGHRHRDEEIDIPPSRPFNIIDLPLAPAPAAFDDLSPASLEAAKRIKESSRKSLVLALGAGALLLGLIVVPFAVKSERGNAAAENIGIPPATANAPAGPAGAGPATNVVTAKAVGDPQGAGDVTFEVQEPNKLKSGGSASARGSTIKTPAPTRKGGAKTGTGTSTLAHAAPPERVEPPAPAPEPPPAPKPKERSELHPNPYGNY